MLHRNVLSRLVDDEIYIKLDNMYRFPNRYKEHWISDSFDEITDNKVVEVLCKKGIIAERENPCEIIQDYQLDNLHVQLTNQCMCKCEHCYVGEKGKTWLSFDEMQMIIDKFVSIGIMSIDYTGGEPTINPDFSRIIEYGKMQGLRQMLFTNGFIAERLYDVICDNIDIIQISLDGNEDYHNNFRKNNNIYQRVLKSLAYFHRHNKVINISFSLSKDNIEYLKHVVDIAQQYNANLRVSPPVPVGENREFSNRYYMEVLDLFRKECQRIGFTPKELIKRKPHCSALDKTVYMNVEKKIYPCPLLNSEEYCIGKFMENPCEILKGDACVEIKKRIKNSIDLHKESVYFCPAFIFNLKIDDNDVFFGEK